MQYQLRAEMLTEAVCFCSSGTTSKKFLLGVWYTIFCLSPNTNPSPTTVMRKEAWISRDHFEDNAFSQAEQRMLESGRLKDVLSHPDLMISLLHA